MIQDHLSAACWKKKRQSCAKLLICCFFFCFFVLSSNTATFSQVLVSDTIFFHSKGRFCLLLCSISPFLPSTEEISLKTLLPSCGRIPVLPCHSTLHSTSLVLLVFSHCPRHQHNRLLLELINGTQLNLSVTVLYYFFYHPFYSYRFRSLQRNLTQVRKGGKKMALAQQKTGTIN